MGISPWIGDFCWISDGFLLDDFSMDFWLKNGDCYCDLSIYMDLSLTDMDNSEYDHDLFMIYGDFWLGMCGDWQKSKMAWDKILPSLVPFTNSRGKGSWFCVRLLQICLQYGHEDVTGNDDLAVGCRENYGKLLALFQVRCCNLSGNVLPRIIRYNNPLAIKRGNWKSTRKWRYPLVNVYITMERSTIFNG